MRKRIVSTPPPLTSILIGVAILGALAYAAFVAYPFVSGPTLSASLQGIEGSSVVISGSTNRVSSLWINDLPTPISDTGNFAVERTFPPGYTEVVVRATDRFGREREQTLTFVNSQFIHHAEESSSQEDTNEENFDEGNSPEGNEGGEESSN